MHYDAIVVGAGSSGCVLAGRLVERGAQVLLLEAGDDAEAHPETLLADQYKHAFAKESLLWDRFSTPQPSCAGRQIFIGTGRGLGGSGSVNAMVYLRGSRADYDSWGLAAWSWDAVVPCFEALEARLRPRALPPTYFGKRCIRAAEDAGFDHDDELDAGSLRGRLGHERMTLDLERNERRSAYAVFVRPLRGRSNLVLQTQAQVRQIELDENATRAVGVRYTRGGHLLNARVREGGSVYLCAGALESPRLLLLSGIGPAAALHAAGIPVRHDLPGVGANLHDHPNVPLFFLGRGTPDSAWPSLYGFARVGDGAGLHPDAADTCYVCYTARSSLREAMSRLVPAMLPERARSLRWPGALVQQALGQAFAVSAVERLVNRVYGIVVILGKPKSRGLISLRSPDADVSAVVDPRYLSDPRDIATLVAGVKLARRMACSAALSEWGNRELMPGASTRSDDALARFVRKQAITTYHFAGTCKMGRDADPRAVVDEALRVRGVAGLCVADASVIPEVPVSALNAPSMLIGWRAADLSSG